jgi:hypothetical protein
MNVMPNVSRERPQESYRYHQMSGIPFVGEPPPMTARDHSANVVTTVRGCFGNFDTAQPDQSHFGRTLNEVLTKNASGEYRLMASESQWISCEKFGIRILRYVEWVEHAERLNKGSDLNATSNPAVSSFLTG